MDPNAQAMIYIGNIDETVTAACIYEIMVNMGVIIGIRMPRSRITRRHQGFAFLEFSDPTSAQDAADIMNDAELCGKRLRVVKLIRSEPEATKAETKAETATDANANGTESEEERAKEKRAYEAALKQVNSENFESDVESHPDCGESDSGDKDAPVGSESPQPGGKDGDAEDKTCRS